MSAEQDLASNDYASKDDKNIPVQDDNAAIEDGIDETNADSDAQLERDDHEAIDKSNIIEERTRDAAPAKGTYREPGDEEGLPTDD